MKVTDKMRLEWLSANFGQIDRDYSETAKEMGEVWCDGENWHPTLFNAIDAAIKASRRKK